MATLPQCVERRLCDQAQKLFLLLLQHVKIYDWRLKGLEELNLSLFEILSKQRTRNLQENPATDYMAEKDSNTKSTKRCHKQSRNHYPDLPVRIRS